MTNIKYLCLIEVMSLNRCTGRIQIKVLATLPLKLQGFYHKINNLNHTIEKDTNWKTYNCIGPNTQENT